MYDRIADADSAMPRDKAYPDGKNHIPCNVRSHQRRKAQTRYSPPKLARLDGLALIDYQDLRRYGSRQRKASAVYNRYPYTHCLFRASVR